MDPDNVNFVSVLNSISLYDCMESILDQNFFHFAYKAGVPWQGFFMGEK